MAEKSGVLEMANGKERLTFPGPGGYKIEWMPGAVHIPLQRAQSGHLMAPLDAYDLIDKNQGGVSDVPTATLHAVVEPSVHAVAELEEQLGNSPDSSHYQ